MVGTKTCAFRGFASEDKIYCYRSYKIPSLSPKNEHDITISLNLLWVKIKKLEIGIIIPTKMKSKVHNICT